MKWKRSNWNCLIIFMVLVLEVIEISCRERSRSNLKRDKQAMRSRKVKLEKEQARFLRRILDTSLASKRLRHRISQRWSYPERDYDEKDLYDTNTKWKKRRPKQNAPFERRKSSKQKGHKNFDFMIDTNKLLQSCCPYRMEQIEPSFGRNRKGNVVQLYKNDQIQQRFEEITCHPKFVNQPCRFMQGMNYKLSRCIQQFSYTYALVRSNETLLLESDSESDSESKPNEWTLDHIQVKSGCVCRVSQQSF